MVIVLFFIFGKNLICRFFVIVGFWYLIWLGFVEFFGVGRFGVCGFFSFGLTGVGLVGGLYWSGS